MNRTTLSLAAVATALAAVTGFAALTASGADAGATPAAAAGPAARLPVERSSALCPAPSDSDVADTTYTSFTPQGAPAAGSPDKPGAPRADLVPAVSPDAAESAKGGKKPVAEPLLGLTQPGKPVSKETKGGDATALIGSASGAAAPGWTTQQTTALAAGDGRGLLGLTCPAPDTDLWFPGASASADRQDYVHLTNPDDAAVVADVDLYGPEGELKSQLTEGVTVPARSSVPVLLSTLTGGAETEDVTVHVTTRSGRVGAAVRAAHDEQGGDWLTASADPAAGQVLPGIPADATSVRLVAYAPGEDDADLKIQLAGKTGTFTPAAAQSLRVKSGMTAAIDLKNLTRGEAGSLVLTPSQPGRKTPVVAALKVVRGSGDKQETAFIPASGPVGERATVADNRAEGGTLMLTAPTADAEVEVTASAGSGGGEPAAKTYTVKRGTTMALTPPVPAGLKGSYALTVETVSGGPVHAARMLAAPEDGIPMFTVQPLTDDRGTVEIPTARQDLTVLTD
ncbi:DUF5719 family protein [Streptomyces sp. ODS05-4]|uniref:DUF5719 family protein n=1 Tax=Streptomyces sp. ODS05-4 TaxID=2944939 RepID=UPI00210F0C4F|nr:DUF5719 family protein [Streptomyces sp. ODS05-4]